MCMCMIKVNAINIISSVCLENVALHKTSWQMNPYLKDEFSASLAVDGKKTNLFQWGGECVASGIGRTAEWRVDLNGVISIHHIVIQYVQNKPVWGIYFYVLYSMELSVACVNHKLFSIVI